MAKKSDIKNSKNGKSKGKKKKKKKSKKPIIFLCTFLVLCIAFAFGFFKFKSFYNAGGIKINPSELGREVTIKINKGATAYDISQTLKNNEIIDSSIVFALKTKKDGIAQNFKPGTFKLNTNMDYKTLVNLLQNPIPENQPKITIPEGFTQDQIGRLLEKNGIVTYKKFMEVCNTTTFNYPFLKNLPNNPARVNKLEGYLYPDTYFISVDETAESIINKMLSRFNELYTKELQSKAIQMNLTTDQVITIASIIEREVKYAPEKPLVASVIFNRLNQRIKLQMDATVLYAKNEHSNRTTLADTKIESPYNTYFVEGLPVGPISNPSIDTIKAVLNPAKTGYLYYVLKNESTGEHTFTTDYNTFLKAKEDYIKKFNK